MSQPKYRRVLLKISGEALGGKKGQGFDLEVMQYLVDEIKPVVALSVQIGIIVGGGNLCRGAELTTAKVDRVSADHVGMIGTLMNAVILRSIFTSNQIAAAALSALPLAGVVEAYSIRSALNKLENHRVLILAGGTGNPFVTTDTALSLRGVELQADLLLKATNVDGVYSADPKKNPQATRYSHLTYTEVLQKELKVMDLAAFCQCRDYNMKLRVYDLHKRGALLRMVMGEDEGTLVESNE